MNESSAYDTQLHTCLTPGKASYKKYQLPSVQPILKKPLRLRTRSLMNPVALWQHWKQAFDELPEGAFGKRFAAANLGTWHLAQWWTLGNKM